MAVVYAITCGEYVKVGTTAGRPERRLRAIQAMCPYPCRLAGVSKEAATGDLTLESWHHANLRHAWHAGEWFHLTREVREYLATYFGPADGVAPRRRPARHRGPGATRLRDAARERLGG